MSRKSVRGPGTHHLADGHGRDVRPNVVEPAALGGLERQPQRAHEDLSIDGGGDGLLDELEAVVGDDAGRSVTEHELLVHVVAHRRSLYGGVRVDHQRTPIHDEDYSSNERSQKSS